MYIKRDPKQIFRLAVLALAISFFEKLIKKSIKEVAEENGVSEKQLHIWKERLKQEGLSLFSCLRPGKRKEVFLQHQENEKLLIYEVINRLLVETETGRAEFSAEIKEKILQERERLKERFCLSYQKFAELIGIPSRTLRLWAKKYREGGGEALEDKSPVPKDNKKKLPPVIIEKIQRCGEWWRRKRGKIRPTEFSNWLRLRCRKLLLEEGHPDLADNTITRYLKEVDLYQEKEEKPKGKRGSFIYYFPGAQGLIDTCQLYFLGVRAYVIGVMDAFSRGILSQSAFLRETKEAVVKVTGISLKEAKKFRLKLLSLVSDHGRVYKAKDTREYLRSEGILPIFAPPYWPEGKAAIERYFRTLKEAIYVRPGKLLRLFLKGLARRAIELGKRVITWVLNVILQGIQEEYNSRSQREEKQSPDEKVSKGHTESLKKATWKVLEERAATSSLKRELIDSVYKEFGLTVNLAGAKKCLSRYRKESIVEAAEALRRKLVVEDLAPMNRWYYLSKVTSNIEERRKELELKQAEIIISREKKRRQEEEDKREIQRQREWHETHPQESLQSAIEWYLLFYPKKLGLSYYEGTIIENVVKILKSHSLLTAPLRLKEIGENILSEDTINRLKNKAEKQGLNLPSEIKMREAKERILELLQGGYAQAGRNLPPIQNLRSLYLR